MDTTHDFQDGNGPVPAHRHSNSGGWVADTAHVDPSAYVGPEALVFGRARVFGWAQVYDEARVFGQARVFRQAQVSDKARVFGSAQVSGQALVFGQALVSGQAQVFGMARVYGRARVSGQAQVYGEAWVYDEAWVYGEARVYDEAQVYDEARVSGEARVCGRALVYDEARVTGDGWRWGDTPSPTLEEQRELAREILARIKSGGGLEMDTWHTCKTTHCLAGWAQVCRGLPEEPAAAYEAGVRLIPALAPWFFSTNDLAMEKLLELAGEVNEVKAFFSTRVDKFRPPYGAPQGGSK